MCGRPLSYQRQPMRKNLTALPITSPRCLCSFGARTLPTPLVDPQACERLSTHCDSTSLPSVHVLIKCYLLHSFQKHSSNLFVQIDSCRRSVYCSLGWQWYRYFHVAIGIPGWSSGPLYCRCGVDWKGSWRRLCQSRCQHLYILDCKARVKLLQRQPYRCQHEYSLMVVQESRLKVVEGKVLEY